MDKTVKSFPSQSSAAGSTPNGFLSPRFRRELSDYYDKLGAESDPTPTPTDPNQVSIADLEKSEAPKSLIWTVEDGKMKIPAYLQHGNYILPKASYRDSVRPEVLGTREPQPSACFTIELDEQNNTSYKAYLEPPEESQDRERVELSDFKIDLFPDDDPDYVRLFGHQEPAVSWLKGDSHQSVGWRGDTLEGIRIPADYAGRFPGRRTATSRAREPEA
jgi:hypothetical protein